MGGQDSCAKVPQISCGRVEGYYAQPVELTDTEKAIYLKLVELAKAGRIEWLSDNYGQFGDYTVGVGTDYFQVNKRRGDNNSDMIVACEIRGSQISGDLREIAAEQCKVRLKTLQDAFLQS